MGYGIVSLQAKEAKHSGVKEDLTLTNRSNVSTATGKWWQVMRNNYVHSFYLPEHQPIPSSYTSHYQSRCPPHCYQSNICNCGRNKKLICLVVKVAWLWLTLVRQPGTESLKTFMTAK